ncbi:MAG: hypothetical protein HRT57_13140 [Crocinitomicaceae bacterium]|nr:hypothetical protein [Crocinitomicaceae bacterium]
MIKAHIILLIIVLMFTQGGAYAQNDSIPVWNPVPADVPPFDSLEYDQIVAYTINFDKVKNQRTHFQIHNEAKNYKLSPFYTAGQQIVPDSLFAGIIDLFSDTATFGTQYADCFEPRFVLQFKNAGIETFRIVICEGCRYAKSTVPLPAAHVKHYDTLVEDREDSPYYHRRFLKGFSETGAEKINALCRTLNLPYCRSFE